jgi:uncharacterized protein YacL
MQFLKLLFTLFFIFLFGIIGYQFSHVLNQVDYFAQTPAYALVNDIVLTTVGGIVGFLVSPYFFLWFVKYIESSTKGMQELSTAEILAGAGGLVFGLVVSSLATYTLVDPILAFFSSVKDNPFVKPMFILILTLFFTTLSVVFTIRIPFFGRSFYGKGPRPKILDTSAIIDGRIADVFETGFLEGGIIIPKFVLEELQRVADSADPLKRNRGRRGLDILNKMRQSKLFTIQIIDQDFPGLEVDAKLVSLAKELHGVLVTTDYNLNKVARFQGIPILNVNELANAVKPVVLPGEELKVQILREGKEQGQGVAYLEDGTMVVVENGKRYIGETLDVEVTSILQTAAGKMIFAKPKLS